MCFEWWKDFIIWDKKWVCVCFIVWKILICYIFGFFMLNGEWKFIDNEENCMEWYEYFVFKFIYLK